jgi:GNAT superfamily N-acetyltransferase
MADTVTIRPYRDSDLDEVLDLLRLALGETALLQRTPALFAWKHLDNPFGRSIMLVAETEGQLVGFRALMRWELVAPHGDIVKSVRPVDTATHPEFQRRGIFRRLTLEALEIATGEGMELVFNTPNKRSGAGYAAMGWIELGPIEVLLRPSSRLMRRSSRDRQIPEPAEMIEDPGPADDLVPVRRPPRGLTTRRNSAYVNWRFARHPTARYSVVGNGDGQAVLRPNLRRGRRELVISDMFGFQPRVAARAARRSSRPDYLVASFQRGTPERSALIRAGLFPVPGLQALTLYVRPLVALPFDATSLSAWDLALSDLELL